MFKRTLSYLSVIALMATLNPVQASALVATPSPLIKGSGPAVYYLSANGKRLVFPTEKTFYTWYPNFNEVRTISDTELASLSLGGNVTYRPGVSLIKITTDPRVYAVDRYGVLRHIGSEAVAIALYGADWAKNVSDLPDAFFVNYKIGTPITESSQYNPAAITSAATSIDAERMITVPVPTPSPEPVPTPTPISTSFGTLLANKTTVQSSSLIEFFAKAATSSVSTIKLYVDGVLSRECASQLCTSEERLGTLTSSSVQLTASFKSLNGTTATETIQLPVKPGSAGIKLMTTHPDIQPGTPRETVATVDSAIFTAGTIDIYMDGQLVKNCTNSTECRYTEIETSATGTKHVYTSRLTRASGEYFESEGIEQRVVENTSPIIHSTFSSTYVSLGQKAEILYTTTDDDGIASIDIYVNDVIAKTCTTTSCSLSVGPWTQAQQIRVKARATDKKQNSSLTDQIVILTY